MSIVWQKVRLIGGPSDGLEIEVSNLHNSTIRVADDQSPNPHLGAPQPFFEAFKQRTASLYELGPNSGEMTYRGSA